METVISTTHLPLPERLDYWYDQISRVLAPVEVTSNDPEGFRAEMRSAAFGPVHVSSLVVSSCESQRTPQLIRQSDPDLVQLVLALRGHNIVEQDRRDALLRPLDLILYHTSRPFRVQTVAERGTATGIMVVFPRALLPVQPYKLKQVTVRSLSGHAGIGLLLSSFLTGLTANTNQYRISDLSRLGTLLIDLLTTLLAHELETDTSLPFENHERILLLRIHAFVQQHLIEPGLSPGMIAIAHNISRRSLHRLFASQNSTVAELIRTLRLERCRRDLADPAMHKRSIHVIAARWGFPNAAHFTRTFRAAYGLTPQDYRRVHQSPELGARCQARDANKQE